MTVTSSPSPAVSTAGCVPSSRDARARLSVIAQSAHHLMTLRRDELEACAAAVATAVARGADIYTLGNGGSATTASHLTCDLTSRPVVGDRLARAHTVHDLARTTAVANDDGYDEVFATPLRGLLRGGDLLIAISVSGRSSNVVRALALARRRKVTTMALLGSDGGEARSLADVDLVVPCDDPGVVESVHLAVVHEIASLLRESKDADDISRQFHQGGD
ncbi:SIS domain-containing protein [Streptomyces sp. DSM 41524]|uniref:SIS domain-containing protein n=1 Tax=Streptomyces asiaticus subsp. ignotus TaxID=3098222 RepID=A0ABU7Q403_9ACTN|nr:SIS domain-containing protein [Streptomyces sp. DSM 41524]